MLACTSPPETPAQPAASRCDDRAIYHSAARTRVSNLERQVARLRADLQQAEAAMVAIESGLRTVHSRADAVSALAEARIAVDRAARADRWRPAQLREARDKLAEAEIQLEAGHTGSTFFFATRARRIAEALNDEAEQVARTASTRFVNTRRANLRAGPSMDDPVVETLNADGGLFLTHARLDGKLTIRICIGQPLTEYRHVRGAWEKIVAAAGRSPANS